MRKVVKDAIPYMVTVDSRGQADSGTEFWFIPGKFRFCLNCGTTHEAHGKDANRLSSLSGEGRSSATTMIALAALQQLFELPEPASGQPDPRKLLGFTDNRQDAVLQAGHFNDFIFLLTLRAGLIGALQGSGGQLDEEHLAESVFTRDELRYILDPADIMGEDYPSETFRVLKDKERKEFDEYRTQRLMLEAWDKLEIGELA